MVVAIILLIPSIFGFINTDVNYDLLSYIPDDVSTTKVEAILKDKFGVDL